MKKRTLLGAQKPAEFATKPAVATTVVCIAGMHRSGTSMLSHLFQKCGMYLGESSELMPSSTDNPAGFWENLEFVTINDELLGAVGGAWDSPPSEQTDWKASNFPLISIKAEILTARMSSRRFWGWKDPRNCLTLPFWMQHFPDLKIVISVRHPLEVAISLHRRNSSSFQLGLALWVAYNKRLVQSIPKEQRLITHYDAYFDDPKSELRRVLGFLGTPVSDVDITESVSTVANKMRHSHFTWTDLLDAKCGEDVIDLYRSMCGEAGRMIEESKRSAEFRGEKSGNGASTESKNGAPGLQTGAMELEIARRDMDTLRSQVDARDRTICDIHTQLAAKNTELICRLDELSRRDATVRDLQGEIASRSVHLVQDQSEKLVNLSVECEKGNAALQRLTAELAARDATIQDLHVRLAASKSEVDSATVALTKRDATITQITDECVQKDANISELADEKRAAEDTLATAKTELDASEAELRQRETVIARFESDLAARHTALREALQENRDLHTRLADAAADLSQRKTEIKQVRAESDIRESNLQLRLIETHAALLKRDEQFQKALTEPPKKPGLPVASGTAAISKEEYLELISKIRQVVERVLPKDATVIVVSKGDDALLSLGAQRGWHFPRTESGTYAGHYPEDSGAAIRHLEKLRREGGQFFLLPQSAFWWLHHFAEFREHLRTKYRVVHDGSECIIFNLGHTEVLELQAKHYGILKPRLRDVVCTITPEGAPILVISKGDNELVTFEGRKGGHFPQIEDGTYAGHHPADSAQAIAALDALREKGASYLVIPESAFWWLDFYKDFRAHLDTHYCKIRQDESCIVYQLTMSEGLKLESPWIQHLKDRADQALAMLTENARLVTQLKDAEARALARSVDTFAKSRLRVFLGGPGRLTFPKVTKPVVSIVIPTFNQAHCTYLALEALLAMHSDAQFEVVIVDNASTDETRALLSRLDNVTIHLNTTNTGFGEASTVGAKLGCGEFVCFLNNDTVPAPGWLDALVQTARTYPRCGAVGAKLVHSDGRLQEAGSIIWQDGSALGYGRGTDPQDPANTYLREVDYCSAACLLMPKKLFLRLGAFDERYAPAYYEDTDLCMAIRKAGFCIVYQPLATVFHLEFGSSGAARAVELQLRNRKKFVAKFRQELRAHCPPLQQVPFARDHRAGKRILVVDDRIPHMSAGSGFPRLATMLRILVAEGYLVTFLPRTNPARIEPETTELQQLGIEVLHGVKDIRAALDHRAGLFDAAIVSRPHNTPVIKSIAECNPDAAIIYDAEAVCAFREARQAEIEGKPMTKEEINARIHAELDLMKSADVVLAVSKSECRTIRNYNSDIPVALWGDAVQVHTAPPGFAARCDLLFVGHLATPPNADALIHFSREILPKVRATLRCQLVVVGSSPPPGLFQSGVDLDSLQLTGYVEDLAPVYARCRVFIAPHRFAAGVPRKVIDAMAQGLPCVITELLAGQLGVKNGVEALVARNAHDFVEKTNRLYRDERLWKKVQRAGLEFIRRNYDPKKMAKKLRDCIEHAIARR